MYCVYLHLCTCIAIAALSHCALRSRVWDCSAECSAGQLSALASTIPLLQQKQVQLQRDKTTSPPCPCLISSCSSLKLQDSCLHRSRCAQCRLCDSEPRVQQAQAPRRTWLLPSHLVASRQRRATAARVLHSSSFKSQHSSRAVVAAMSASLRSNKTAQSSAWHRRPWVGWPVQ